MKVTAANMFRQQGDDPYFVINTLNAIIAMNAWLWSTVFHTHDFPITEVSTQIPLLTLISTSLSQQLDYFSAYSVVLFSLYSIVIRILDELLNLNLSHNPKTSQQSNGVVVPHQHPDLAMYKTMVHIVVGAPFVAMFTYHVHYLSSVYFDYGYNMRVNLITGASSSGLWLLWAAKHYYYRQKYKSSNWSHIRKGVLTVVALNACLMLEVFDFEPIWYTFDAHSLWHACTAAIPFYWFR